MRWFVRLLPIVWLWVSVLGFVQVNPAQAVTFTEVNRSVTAVVAVETSLRNRADDRMGMDYGRKIDLNNTDVRRFQRYPGLYPTLAKVIVDHAPYKNVEDVLKIAGLSDRQKRLLETNLGNFTVTEVVDIFNEGDDRFNPAAKN